MKNRVKQVLIFVGGLLIGALVGFVVMISLTASTWWVIDNRFRTRIELILPGVVNLLHVPGQSPGAQRNYLVIAFLDLKHDRGVLALLSPPVHAILPGRQGKLLT